MGMLSRVNGNQVPIHFFTKGTILPNQIVTWLNCGDAFNHCDWIVSRPEGQVIEEPGTIEASRYQACRQQSAHLRPKQKILGGGEVIERLDAQRVSGEEQPVVPRVPDGEGKHPAEFLQTALAPTTVCLQQ